VSCALGPATAQNILIPMAFRIEMAQSVIPSGTTMQCPLDTIVSPFISEYPFIFLIAASFPPL
jgi:hypothetical protein